MSDLPLFRFQFVTYAVCIGIAVGVSMSLVYNGMPNVSAHVTCAIVTGAMFVPLGILLGIRDLQRRRRMGPR